MSNSSEFDKGYLAALKDVAATLQGSIDIRERQAERSEHGSDFCKTITGTSTGPQDGLRRGE